MDNLPVAAELENSLVELDEVVFKRYLEVLDQLPVFKEDLLLKKAIQKTRLNKIRKIVYDKNEDNLEKLISVFSSMALHESSVFILLKGDGQKTDIYIGTQSLDENEGHLAIETFERSLKASFPGLELGELYSEDVESISSQILSPETKYVTSVSGVPSQKGSESQGFVQGLDKVIEGMQGRTYTAMMLASPVNRQHLEVAESAYQDLYSALSIMETDQVSLSESQSETVGKTVGTNISRTISDTLSKSQSSTHGRTNTSSQSSSVNTSKSRTTGLSIFVASNSSTKSKSKTESTSHSQAVSNSDTKGSSSAKGRANTKGSSESESISSMEQISTTHQLTLKNRRVSDILELIDEQLKRIRDFKNHGMWNLGTYFLSDKQSTTQIGADLLSGILSGESTGIERNAILNWSSNERENRNFSRICESLARFTHPRFNTSSKYSFDWASATSLISSKELSVGMCFPQKSLPSLPVFDAVEFGRSVSEFDSSPSGRKIKVGSIYHLGSISKELKVDLNVELLTSHVFVTGSTGSGKSTTIYSVMHDLWKMHSIPFLVIEPAKGEYKNVFGGEADVQVLGTNHDLTPLLQVNPFSFPVGIHITEHIDRFIEILNAVWPMYAAMPAVLKSGVEKAYEKMGWNLISSDNPYGRVFPDFHDLLKVLPEIISESSYSEEMKGNYTGALVTRIHSLTNGYFRSIFRKEELEDEVLFDAPCIVDLSRVGSSETKSLLMGILFMKLQEWRMTRSEGGNSKLKHITIMEEAHNLMRRTSPDQSSEGANLQGKAVEMISNAIAEMRTFGEGFIIADQAPGLLDQSVIRNTNTKIILRLPDWEDRELVGKAANLKDEQIEELARLQTGCAAVYQNNWQEAVLCQFDKYAGDESKFAYEPSQHMEFDSRERCRQEFLGFLLNCRHDKILPSNSPENIDPFVMYFVAAIKRLNTFTEFSELAVDQEVARLINIKDILRDTPKIRDRKEWIRIVLYKIFRNHKKLSSELRKELADSIFSLLASLKPEQKEMWIGEREKLDEWESFS